MVLAEEAAEIADVEPGRHFLETQYRAVGEKLRDQLSSVEEPGVKGDRIVTDAWAGELGLKGWYEWVRLDEAC